MDPHIPTPNQVEVEERLHPREHIERGRTPKLSSYAKRALKRERARNFRLQKKLQRLQQAQQETKQPTSLKDVIEVASQYLQKPALSFFESQMRLAKIKAKGRRWTEEDKLFAISLYHQGPKSYRMLSKIWTLPHIRSIRKWLQNIDLHTGFPTSLMSALEAKVINMSEKDRCCSIVFDEVSLRCWYDYNKAKDEVEGVEDFATTGRTIHQANHALVVMVRGLFSKWKQPIGYFLVNGATPSQKLVEIINECIPRLKDIGLRPKVMVCDQGAPNVSMYEKLGVSKCKPYFEVGHEKIFAMHDPPHLLKNTRNNLMKYDIKFGDNKVAKWKHVVEFYQEDQRRRVRMARKLTNKHIFPTTYDKMRVCIAAQTLSASVAAGIQAMVSTGHLPQEAVHTAEFIKEIDELFDSLNSRSFKAKKYARRPLSPTSIHWNLWEQKLKMLSSLELIGAGRTQCIEGWKLGIACVKQLWAELRQEFPDIKYMFLARLNQDCIENLFSVIRSKGGAHDTPSCQEFRFRLRGVVVSNLLTPHSTANCIADDDRFLLKLSNFARSSQRIMKPTRKFPTKEPVIMPEHMDLPEQNTLAYISGYLCKRVLPNHEYDGVCSQCRKALLNEKAMLGDLRLSYLHFKAYEINGRNFGFLQVPSSNLLTFITMCEKEFNDIFWRNVHVKGIAAMISSAITKHPLYPTLAVCSEYVRHRLVTIFVSMRIHHELNITNKAKKISQSSETTIRRPSRKTKKVTHQ